MTLTTIEVGVLEFEAVVVATAIRSGREVGRFGVWRADGRRWGLRSSVCDMLGLAGSSGDQMLDPISSRLEVTGEDHRTFLIHGYDRLGILKSGDEMMVFIDLDHLDKAVEILPGTYEQNAKALQKVLVGGGAKDGIYSVRVFSTSGHEMSAYTKGIISERRTSGILLEANTKAPHQALVAMGLTPQGPGADHYRENDVVEALRAQIEAAKKRKAKADAAAAKRATTKKAAPAKAAPTKRAAKKKKTTGRRTKVTPKATSTAAPAKATGENLTVREILVGLGLPTKDMERSQEMAAGYYIRRFSKKPKKNPQGQDIYEPRVHEGMRKFLKSIF